MISDFGFSSDAASADLNDYYVGTLGYIAPEVLQCKEGYSFKSDIFSLGSTLFLLLTGEKLFNDPSEKRKMIDNMHCLLSPAHL